MKKAQKLKQTRQHESAPQSTTFEAGLGDAIQAAKWCIENKVAYSMKPAAHEGCFVLEVENPQAIIVFNDWLQALDDKPKGASRLRM